MVNANEMGATKKMYEEMFQACEGLVSAKSLACFVTFQNSIKHLHSIIDILSRSLIFSPLHLVSL